MIVQNSSAPKRASPPRGALAAREAYSNAAAGSGAIRMSERVGSGYSLKPALMTPVSQWALLSRSDLLVGRTFFLDTAE